MDFLKLNKVRLRLTAQLIVFVYFSLLFSQFMVTKGNISIEEDVLFTDKPISVVAEEFNNTMKHLQEEADLLSKEDKNKIQSITLLYSTIKWLCLSLAAYIVACALLKYYINDQTDNKI